MLAEPGHSGTGYVGIGEWTDPRATSIDATCLAGSMSAVAFFGRLDVVRSHATNAAWLWWWWTSHLGPNGLRLTRSRMDLWFEDETSAAHACKIISTKIVKARSRRGGRIQAALLTR